jgi:hypothetical protein
MTALVVVIAIGIVHGALHERMEVSFLNETTPSAEVSIGRIVPDVGSIAVDPGATVLLRQVADCHRRFPSRWTAVLPGPALVYAVMDLSNPFPVDWIYPLEINGSSRRLIQAADKLNAEGNYLVLLRRYGPGVPPNPLMDQIVQKLSGARTACDGLVALYSPAAAGRSENSNRGASDHSRSRS